MIQYTYLEPRFVKRVPDVLEPGIIYVSMEFGTAIHSCCCGCGIKVVTPLEPDQWRLTYDGDTITLRPSVGNWDFPCQSHYLVTRNRVEEAEWWSRRRIQAARQLQKNSGDAFSGIEEDQPGMTESRITNSKPRGLFQRIASLFRDEN